MIRWLLTTAVLSSTLAWSAQADTLTMERSVGYSPPNSAEGVPRPVRGTEQERVRSQFGEPLRIVGPVGEPPISRWEYDRFTVVFERQYVLHSVVHREQPLTAQ